MADLLNRVGRSAFNYLSGQEGSNDGFVGSIVQVDNIQVQIMKLLGEGGYAFIYAAKELTSSRMFALKRFLVFDEGKVAEVVQEIRLMKDLREQGDFVKFIKAASVDNSVGKKVNKEFLLLMELCSGGDLAQLLQRTGESLTPDNVCVVMAGLARALHHLHTKQTPVIHRDIKLENLLLSEDNEVRLCDLGSASTKQFHPTQDWGMNQRSLLEDELAKYSTPMYRAPEMLDTWSNFPVNQAVDIWAAGLVLYAICFNKHPFDDSNKLAIVNGNYKIPASDSKYRMYHSLISSMLTLDPRQRPSAGQVLDQLSAIAETEGFRCRGSLANIESPQQHLLSPTQTPTQDLPPRLPDGPTIFNPETQPASSNVSMLKASAGSLFSRLKDTTKTVVASVQSSMVGKELDFHCITSRVAAMSLPVEGLESAYRNHIDDVRALMENKHSNYYTVFNVSERQSNPSKYPSGHLVEAGWPAGAVPSLDAVLELCTKMLDYLSRDLRNVLVVYCLDGKSSTAYIVSALLIYSGLASSVEAAVTIFSAKRCDPVLTSCQLESLRHLASLAVSKLPVLKSPFVTVTNVVVEPVPLFNKAGDGCRPYVEVYQGKERVISTVQEYSRMKGYSVTAGDEDIVIPVNVTVCGDVTIIVNHARQVLGSIKPVKICQVQLHTSSLTAGRPSYQWKLSQLDCVAEAARYSDGFQLVMNCETSEECSGRDVQWPDESAALLLFNSDQDYEMVKSLAPGTSTRAPVSPDGGNSKFYVNNPDLNRDEENSSRATAAPSASSVRPPVSVDLLGLSEAGPAQQESLISSLSGPRPPAPEKSHIDLLAAAAPAPRPPAPEKSKIDLLAAVAPTPAPPAASANTFDFLADLNGPSAANNKPAPPAGNISDLFGGSDKFSAPVLNATSIPRGTSQPDIKTDAVEDNFDPFSNLSNLSASLSSQNIAAGQNKPVNPGPQKPMNSMGNSTGFSQQKPQSKPMGPNYSRSFFSDSSNSVGGVKPKVSMNAFDDLLGGFTPSANPSQNQSIGAMKKTELVKAMDPDEAKIFEWKEGKSRNIRTLLCSLHKIIWAGARWSECGMHQLVSSNDVKKMYRKACLAVHPDKQMGTENENISKLIFMELNEAWSEFENDPNQQNMFG